MSRQTVQENKPASPRLREGMLIAVAAACAYLLVSLLSYSPDDPAWSATGSGGSVRNLGGPTGAWLADVSFSLVGYLAYLFPLLLGYRAALLFADREQSRPFSWTPFSIRLCGLVLSQVPQQVRQGTSAGTASSLELWLSAYPAAAAGEVPSALTVST